MIHRYSFFLLFALYLIFCIVSCAGCNLPYLNEKNTVSIVSYNVQNYFDTVSDGTEYPEYDPTKGEWSQTKLDIKTKHIAKAIKECTPGGPDIVTIQEIENINALQYLIKNGLSNSGYSYSVTPRPSHTATSIGILSRFPITSLYTHAVTHPDGPPLRYIIEATIEINDITLVLFVNHWKSKLGGAEKTEKYRRSAAAVLNGRLEQIILQNPNSEICITGDMNENIDEYYLNEKTYYTAILPYEELIGEKINQSFVFTTDAEKAQFHATEDGVIPVFYSPWNESEIKGSYAYQKKWTTPDHFFLSPGLLDNTGFYYKSFSVAKQEYLFTDEGFPKKWFNYKSSGYSDHLPILLSLEFDPSQ